jgi:adenylate kinase family enzyme
MYEVVDYYTDRGVLSIVDGAGEVAQVTDALLHAIAQPARLQG